MGTENLYAHLETGVTTVCRAWAVTRTDGLVLGFTDHDQDLEFGAVTFRAETGLTARSLQQQTGLSVDNTEAIGGFSDDAITEADLAAGRYDGAIVKAWLVNWQAADQRVLQFSGQMGEITRADGRFTAELRSLVDRLNQPRGRAYHRACGAILGDDKCRFDMSTTNYSMALPLLGFDSLGRWLFDPITEVEASWFSRGQLIVQTGIAAGLSAVIKLDKLIDNQRVIELWDALGTMPQVGDSVLLRAGCDKLGATCQTKFGNFLNFRGFPHIPGEDWQMSYPVSLQSNDGGSLFK
jgi:uncharacterized phage protein (TIGR02218 family)